MMAEFLWPYRCSASGTLTTALLPSNDGANCAICGDVGTLCFSTAALAVVCADAPVCVSFAVARGGHLDVRICITTVETLEGTSDVKAQFW